MSQAILDIHLYQCRHPGQKRRFLLFSFVHRRIFPFLDKKADPGEAQQECHGKPGINPVRIFPGILQKEKVERSGRTSQNHHQDRNEPADEHMRNHIRIQIEEDRADEKIEKLVNIIEKSSMLEFSIQEGDTKIKMSRRGSAGVPGEPLTVVKTEAPAEDTVDENYIISPIVGTFYSAPSPDAEAFVKVGDVVKAGQTVCILEAMKLMNEIESDYDCEIEAVLVSNEQKVEYGQPLFKVKKLSD